MNKIVMITGASGGLGQTAGRMMMEAGWQVAQVTRDESRLDHRADTVRRWWLYRCPPDDTPLISMRS